MNPEHAPRPNIVIINCDDLGYGDLSSFGSESIQTPNIDKLAEGGVKFDSFYACNSLCTPSRFGLLTGRYPERAGVGSLLLAKHIGPRTTAVDNANWWAKFNDQYFRWWFVSYLSKLHFWDFGTLPELRGIPEEEITIGQALQTVGYRTGLVGKWHLGEFPVYPEYNPLRHGFDYFYGVPHANNMRDFALYRNEECLSPDFTEMDQLTGLYTREAVQFIHESKDKPFFLYFAHTYPHTPQYASKNFRGKSMGGLYGDCVEEIDWSVAEVMRALEENGVADNTLVIFTSDNGPGYCGSPGGLRGRKGQSYEGGFRVPMIAHWPKGITAKSICSEPAMNIDLFPTMLSLAGVDLPEDRVIDGKNILSLLTSNGKRDPNDCLFFYHNKELEAVRMGKWKYIRDIDTMAWPIPLDKHWKSENSLEAPWLYNLELDPGESYNLRREHPDIVEAMEAIFQKWQKSMKENLGGWK
ncbi:sulfatase [Candidatus Villigracilis saccharophilus]|uniref:sulfatase family protein n=1 Tax=Candidatus Villigracilis saccharophilus TaxID=3140684 RepID=UPI003136C66F|nr:sulfatase [Anaerolineales bacterium]